MIILNWPFLFGCFLILHIRRALNKFRVSGVDSFLSLFFKPLHDLDCTTLKRVVSTVSGVEGGEFKYLKHYRLGDLPSCDLQRQFWIVECLLGGNSFPLFVKVGGVARKRFRVAKILSGLNLPVPKYYGSFFVQGRTVSFWKYHHGVCIKSFKNFSDAQFFAAARAIAIFNVVGSQCVDRRVMKFPQLWNGKVAHRVSALTIKYPVLAVYVEVIDFFARAESQMLERLLVSGCGMLNHNDFKASNMLFLASGECLITDLDSTALGPAGASLRCFSILPFDKRELLVNEYVKWHADFGVTVSAEQVHCAMCIQQIFWGFHTGVRLLDIARIERTLKLFSSLFTVERDCLVLHGGFKV